MGLPKPEKDDAANAPAFNPFLKAQQIGRLGAKAKLVFRGKSRLSDGSFGEQLMIEVLYKGKVWDYAVKTASPNYRILYDRFGSNEKKWKGPVNVEVKHFASNDYIAVARERDTTTTRKVLAFRRRKTATKRRKR